MSFDACWTPPHISENVAPIPSIPVHDAHAPHVFRGHTADGGPGPLERPRTRSVEGQAGRSLQLTHESDKKMVDAGLWPNDKTYSSVVNAHAQAGEAAGAKQWSTRSWSRGIFLAEGRIF